MSAPKRGVAVFSDYDATITDIDTFDLLAQESAGRQAWEDLDDRLHSGALTLREVLVAQAALIHMSLDEADALLRAHTTFDPAFAHFVLRCESEGVAVTVLSSGVQQLIERAFARHNLEHVAIFANGIEPLPSGWKFRFRDGSDNGHDKAKAVRESRDAGIRTIYCGDGPSDYTAALAADVRFAKRGLALERFLREEGLPFTPFDTFADVEAALFALA